MKYRFCILKSEDQYQYKEWESACIHAGVQYDIADITCSRWLEQVIKHDYSAYLLRPPDKTDFFKKLYDERVYILNRVLGRRIYPTLNEIFVYENKRFLAGFLKALSVRHPETSVFHDINEAKDFIKESTFPLVCKTFIGAGASGVRILKNLREAENYLSEAFSKRGIKRSWGPNLNKGNISERIREKLKNPFFSFREIMEKRKRVSMDPQRYAVLFQEYIKVKSEWRIVKIGESYFGHKKLMSEKGFHSGTSQVKWDLPEERMLNFVCNFGEKSGFSSFAADIFETRTGELLVNEIQCCFGSKNPHQMLKEGEPGRFVKREGEWEFEKGIFNTNNSYDLRLAHLMDLLKRAEQCNSSSEMMNNVSGV